MKHDVLASVAHNIADSLASGIGLMVGVYDMDVFGEAARSSEGFIEVDFLTGGTTGGSPSASLSRAISLYSQALPGLCQSHGVSFADFNVLTARFSGRGLGGTVVIEVEDSRGKRSRRRYSGSPLARARVQDALGRVRRTRSA